MGCVSFMVQVLSHNGSIMIAGTGPRAGRKGKWWKNRDSRGRKVRSLVMTIPLRVGQVNFEGIRLFE